MKRLVVVLFVLGLGAGAAVYYFTTCCSQLPATSPDKSSTTERPSDSTTAAAPSAAPAPTAPTPPRDLGRGRAAPPRADVPDAPPEPVAAATATLRVVTDVPGAQVFLNREFVGSSPATANALKPGEYQLNVAAPGFDNHVQTIELAPGDREIIIRLREVRLSASLDVVHKHRFGSCKGRLIATPDGIRYDTTDKDDAFRAALLDLDTFQVDYLNKTLRIQPRTGKRYDFADPDGDADRLFVFHRDVDKARERLRAEGSS